MLFQEICELWRPISQSQKDILLWTELRLNRLALMLQYQSFANVAKIKLWVLVTRFKLAEANFTICFE